MGDSSSRFKLQRGHGLLALSFCSYQRQRGSLGQGLKGAAPYVLIQRRERKGVTAKQRQRSSSGAGQTAGGTVLAVAGGSSRAVRDAALQGGFEEGAVGLRQATTGRRCSWLARETAMVEDTRGHATQGGGARRDYGPRGEVGAPLGSNEGYGGGGRFRVWSRWRQRSSLEETEVEGESVER